MMTQTEAVNWLCLPDKDQKREDIDLDDISALIEAIPGALSLGRVEDVVSAVDSVAERLGWALVVAEKWSASEQWADTLIEITGARGLMHIMSGVDCLALSYFPGRDLARVARVMVNHAEAQEIEPFFVEGFAVDSACAATQMAIPRVLTRMRLAALQGVAIPPSTTDPSVTALTFAQIIGWDDEAVHAAASREEHERYYRYRMYVPSTIIAAFTQDETLDVFAKIMHHAKSWTPQNPHWSAYIHIAIEHASPRCLAYALNKVGEVRARDEYRGIVRNLVVDMKLCTNPGPHAMPRARGKNPNAQKSIRVAARVIPELYQMFIDEATGAGIVLEMLECLEGDDAA